MRVPVIERRFWRSRGTECKLSSDEGFLVDPDQKWGETLNPGLVTLVGLRELPCAILLGESGMGKSTALSTVYGTEPVSHQGNVLTKRVDLGLVGASQELRNRIFGPDVAAALSMNGGVVELILDSLDECAVPHPADVIVDELRGHKAALASLRLRIACRSAFWPASVEAVLTELFGNEHYVYELCPLREADAASIAAARGANSKAFIQIVRDKALTPLAARPITLSLLAQSYARDPEHFAATPAELYGLGMELLVQEPSDRRNESPTPVRVPDDVKLAAAERLGTVSVLSGRRQLATRTATDDQDGLLSYAETVKCLSNGVDLHQFRPSEVADALFYGSALFSTGGAERVRWGHASYADYLAAKCMTDRGMSPKKVAELMFTRDGRKRVVRQLRPVAAWLSAMEPEIRALLVNEDPDVAFTEQVPPGPMNNGEKEVLLRSLLRQHEQPDVQSVDFGLRSRLGTLYYPTVSQLLQPYLADNTRPLPARKLAVLAVQTMKLDCLVGLCLRISLDRDEPDGLRNLAVDAVSAIGSNDTRQVLRSLVLASERPVDESLDVLGPALDALWPQLLTVQELFESLVVPRESTLGDYEYFLTYKLVPSLAQRDYVCALNWVANLDAAWLACFAAESLVDAIIRGAWQLAVGDSGKFPVAEFAAAYWHLVAQRDSSLLWQHGETDHGIFLNGPLELRHAVVGSVLEQSGFSKDAAFAVRSCSTPLVCPDDFPWLVDSLAESGEPAEREVLAQVATYLFRPTSLPQIEALLSHMNVAELHERFKGWVDPVELQSDAASAMRADEERNRQFEKERADDERKRAERDAEKPTLATVSRMAETILNDSAKTAFQRWYAFYHTIVAASPECKQYIGESLFVSGLSAWKVLSPSVQAAAMACTRDYLDEVDPEVDKWIGADKPPTYGVLYGLPCFVLAVETSGEAQVPDRLVERWLPAFLTCTSGWSKNESSELADLLANLAAQKQDLASSTVQTFLHRCMSEEHPSQAVLERIELLWNEEIAQVVLSTAQKADIGENLLSWCLTTLCSKDVPGAEQIAVTLVKQGALQDVAAAELKRAVIGAMALVETRSDWWTLVHETLHQSRELWRSFVQRVSSVSFYEKPDVLKGLSGDQAGILYQWIRDAFPEIGDAFEAGAHCVTPIEQVGDLSRTLLNRLAEGRDVASVEALRDIRNHFAEERWLNRVVSEAEDNLAANTWSPPSVDDVIELLDVHEKRYVESGDNLLDVLEEQLGELQQRLHGETPAWPQLWNENGQDWTPKEETRVSDWVKEGLELSLVGRHIIVNREVEIRRGAGPEVPGERTDIKVDATREHAPNVEAIIEVKGCWNPELLTSMRDQLARRYLAENKCHHGIYLVAWFNCDTWSVKDSRKKVALRRERVELEQLLLNQAELLRADGYFIRVKFLNCCPPHACPEPVQG